jgi:hypothetical protein
VGSNAVCADRGQFPVLPVPDEDSSRQKDASQPASDSARTGHLTSSAGSWSGHNIRSSGSHAWVPQKANLTLMSKSVPFSWQMPATPVAGHGAEDCSRLRHFFPGRQAMPDQAARTEEGKGLSLRSAAPGEGTPRSIASIGHERVPQECSGRAAAANITRKGYPRRNSGGTRLPALRPRRCAA